ncbi:tRNA uridine-5-carboxymethylaminomethyl(34) synthesis GTPase MnmE [Rhizobium sp. G187]|uniref:tRNA uridine-5-carboxymethylaminomethyl(34) synthesis GTPase MnmE n=1 Tax=Rhizobium sp. G187 TaxID=3451352 RepID=UPI003EE4C090
MTAAHDTIFALASGAPPAGVAVIRISGPMALAALGRLIGGALPEPRVAALRTLRTSSGDILDKGLVLSFPGPQSFTGEDCAELHIHGGKAVIAAVLEQLAGFDSLRLAEAGEFSRRAFENGKLDLVEIEGLADLLAAETEMQRRLASEQSSGHLSAIYERWRERLIFARAMIEAELDFSDEGDIPGSVSDRIWSEVATLADEIDAVLSTAKTGEIIRDGFRVVLAGAPNAGKSSLMNALVRRDVAIVTEIAGTTRDIVHCELDLDGYKVHLFDTAGLRETDEPVEREGIRRAFVTIADADLVLHLSELGRAPQAELGPVRGDVLTICTKVDLDRPDETAGSQKGFDVSLSAVSGTGIDELRARMLMIVKERTRVGSLAIPSRLRHAQRLSAARASLRECLDKKALPLELKAELLRQAADELARVTGRIDTEMLLGKIFSEFCVGK